MIHRLREWHLPRRLEETTGEAMLYRGVPYDKAVKDASLKRLYFSQAIGHCESVNNKDSGEVFRTEAEWAHLQSRLLGAGIKDSTERSERFFEDADQFSRSCYYISCWSFSRDIAVRCFARNYAHEGAGLMCISQDDLITALDEASLFWNRLKDEVNPTYDDQGLLSLDYEPEYISYALGKIAYVKSEDATGPIPQRLSRAMRMPHDCAEEEEWRIALDLSLIPSPISVAGLVQAGLMPLYLAASLEVVSMPGLSNQREGASDQVATVEFASSSYLEYEQGIWLNRVDPASRKSFCLERL
jgi:hypothetical protein